MNVFGFQWHLTDRCNLRCTHCYQSDFSPKSERSLPGWKEMADCVFGGMPDRKVSINLTGGEPLLLPDLFELIGYLQGFERLEEINLITNGTVVTPEILEEIASFERIGTLKVSLESADEAVNDAVRGEGNLAKVIDNLEKLKGTGKTIVLMTTLARYNLDAIEETVKFAREAGLSGVIFERFVPLGTGRAMRDQVLDPAGWRQALASIRAAGGFSGDPLEWMAFHAFWLRSDRMGGDALLGARCNLGDDSMALMPDGTVFPCRRLPVPVGNLLGDSFTDIMARLAEWRPDRVRGRLYGNLCGMCGVDECAGCRALARAVGGDSLGDDPLCPLHEEN